MSDKLIPLKNSERLTLLAAVKAEIRKGEMEGNTAHRWNGQKYAKQRKRYGFAKMVTLYELEMKLKK